MDTIKTYSCEFYFAVKAKHHGRIDYYHKYITQYVKAKTLEQAKQEFSNIYKDLYKYYINHLERVSLYNGWESYTDKHFDFWESREITVIHLFGHIVKDSIRVRIDYSEQSVEDCQKQLTVSEYNELLKDLGAVNCPLLK